MPNSLNNILPKILARGLLALREQAVMPRLVNGDYSAEAAEKGDTIDVPIPTAQAASDVVPGPAYASAANNTPGKVQIQLNNWKKTNFYMSDKDMAEVDRNKHFMPMQMSEAIRALSNIVNEDIHDEYKGVFGYAGTAGTTPFASTVTDATNARKVLNQQRAPKSQRRGVLDFDADANALALSPFADADKTMSAQVKIEGEIGRKYGIDWVADDAVKTHTAGTLQAVGALSSGVVAVGASSLNIKSVGAVGHVVMGDIFTIAGDTQTYVSKVAVSAVASNPGVAMQIDPPLKVALTGGELLTFKPTHVVNLVFHRDAFAFANRPLISSTQGLSLGNEIMSMTDPQTGITLRLEVSRQNKQVTWEFDILWGAKLVRPELATRVAG